MTQYLLSVNTDWNADLRAADQMERGYQAVEVEDGEVLTTDGPFAETKEQLGGIWIIEARDPDAAHDWSAKASEACGNPVEVRFLRGRRERLGAVRQS